MQIKIYTDGACKGNPGKGGWAAILIAGKHKKEVSGSFSFTTNNEMELTAILGGLEQLNRPCDIVIYTDSILAINWLTDKYKTRKPHITDLVKSIKLTIEIKGHTVRYQHVRGHNGDPLNERADELASKAAEMQYKTKFVVEEG